ncbi:helix-turn-helix transcriptional regulator [Streptomyces sp. DH37]|uniref:helix-turn-helix transcriptional regulator n=1 Tax=Streptomyces sp. DH37 TaxID=3040122 RepID=UPI002441DD48|nr:helix-turn-helix transcriptional regulator [Streptomyces sp. DH37]MDG9704784.1 AAA family ATPase [Streptomyces sp. DH37]
MLGAVDSSRVSPVFVGRGAELAALTDALARAGTGEPQAVVVAGEAGVGKTRLLEEFLAATRARGAVAAVGGCVEIGAEGLPFAPVSTVLRSLHRRLGRELTAAAAGQEGELARLLPELGETTREWHEEDGRARLFELTARLLESLSRERTLVLVVEDLHWADRSTRELLAYLFRSLDRARLVIVATYRSDDIHRRHPLRPFLAELDRLRTVRRIELPRLSREEVRAQMAGIQGVEVPEHELVEQVFQRSEGNPFFVEELTVSGTACGISDSLRDLLLVRVEALPEDAQQVVRTAAEGGSAVEHALLAAVARLPEDELIEALRAAVGANVLAPTQDGDGYRFRHALVREAVSEDLLPGERVGLNRRYAQALENDPSLVRTDERAARLASHWYAAHDVAKALPAVLDAAVAARRRYAYAEQLRLLDRALELWEDATPRTRSALRSFDQAEVYPACGSEDRGNGEERESGALRYLDLLAETVTAAQLSGERKRAQAVIKRALRLLDEERDPLRAAWFWTQRSKLAETTAQGDGWAELGRAQELVRGLPPSPVHAEVLAGAAAWGAVHDPGPDAFSTARRAVELAALVGAASTELHARLTLGSLRVFSGDVDTGLAEMEEVARRAVEQGEVAVVGRCHVNLSSALEGVGRSAEAVQVAEEGLRAAHRFGLQDTRAWLHGNLAESLVSLGRWEEADAALAATRKLARSAKPRGSAALKTAHLAVRRGDPERAADLLAEAWTHYGTHDPQPQYTIPLARLALEIEAMRGRPLQARRVLEEALDRGFPLSTERYAWPLLHAALTVEADARGLPAAEPGRARVLERIREAARRLPRLVPVWAAHGLMLDAELRRAEGRDDPDRWAETAAAFEGLERPYRLAQARHRWAQALLDAGRERERAAGLLARAHATALRLGAAPLRESVERLAGRARVPLPAPGGGNAEGSGSGPGTAAGTPPADPVESFGLTPRERDVLRLVAAGRSNRQIAEELFISPKTASVHVSNILAKLEVSGRGEAAAMAHRLRLVDPVRERGRAAVG